MNQNGKCFAKNFVAAVINKTFNNKIHLEVDGVMIAIYVLTQMVNITDEINSIGKVYIKKNAGDNSSASRPESTRNVCIQRTY